MSRGKQQREAKRVHFRVALKQVWKRGMFWSISVFGRFYCGTCSLKPVSGQCGKTECCSEHLVRFKIGYELGRFSPTIPITH